MNKLFVINKKRYVAKPFDFNLLCDLEDMGVSIAEASNKPMSMVRAYFALCTGQGKDFAGSEMQAHLISGGTFDEIMEAMSEEMENSDFFQSLSKTAEADNVPNTAKKTREKKAE